MTQIDLNQLPDYDLTIKPKETAWDAAGRVVKDVSLHRFKLGIVCFAVWFCYHTVIGPATSPEAAKWAMGLMGTIVESVLGSLTGKPA